MEQLKEQMTELIKNLPDSLWEDFATDLCINYQSKDLLPEMIADAMIKSDLSKHFKNDCEDPSGLSFYSETAGLLCDRENYWQESLPLVVLWLTKQPLTPVDQKKLEQMVKGYDDFHTDTRYREILEDYNCQMKSKYVADCADPSEFLDFVKIAIEMLYKPQPISKWIQDKITNEADTAIKEVYQEWLQFLEK